MTPLQLLQAPAWRPHQNHRSPIPGGQAFSSRHPSNNDPGRSGPWPIPVLVHEKHDLPVPRGRLLPITAPTTETTHSQISANQGGKPSAHHSNPPGISYCSARHALRPLSRPSAPTSQHKPVATQTPARLDGPPPQDAAVATSHPTHTCTLAHRGGPLARPPPGNHPPHGSIRPPTPCFPTSPPRDTDSGRCTLPMSSSPLPNLPPRAQTRHTATEHDLTAQAAVMRAVTFPGTRPLPPAA